MRTLRPALGSRWMERSRRSQKERAGNWSRLQKEQDSPIHFSFAGPKPSPLITSPLAALMQVHSLAGPIFPSDSAQVLRFLPFPIPRGGSQGTVSPQCAGEREEAGGEATCRDLAMRSGSHAHFTAPGENSSQEENY